MQRLAIHPSQIDSNICYLTSDQRHYLIRVLRLRAGDRLILLDGRGQGWLAQLLSEDRADLIEPHQFMTELPLAITLAAALPKHGFDEVVRCCTELGVTQILPILSERTILQPSLHKLTRWRKIATEAAEQSERGIIPKIAEPQPFNIAVAQLSSAQGYLCAARTTSRHFLQVLPQHSAQTMTIWIGPEGGWTEAEIQQAIAQDLTLVSLGTSILRAVTASISAVSLVNGFLTSHPKVVQPIHS